MFLFSRPSDAQIRAFLKERESDSFSYREVGATQNSPPTGYNIDHNRQFLGTGLDAFQRARTAVTQWKMFDVPGMTLCYTDTAIEAGQNVAPLARHLGFYSLNSCRIVYVIDEPYRFGFAYGTLTEHAEIGEERFSVEFNPDTGEVWYDVFAMSQPGNILVKLGYPHARYRQKSFSSESKNAMRRAVAKSTEGAK